MKGIGGGNTVFVAVFEGEIMVRETDEKALGEISSFREGRRSTETSLIDEERWILREAMVTEMEERGNFISFSSLTSRFRRELCETQKDRKIDFIKTLNLYLETAL